MTVAGLKKVVGFMKKIGVLAIQGSIAEHIEKLRQIKDVQTFEIKYVKDLEVIDGLIIPGGESTAIGRLLHDFNLLEPLKQKITAGLPVWGTCAGMITLAKKLVGDPTVHLGTMDIEVTRNAYGRQLGSFVAKGKVKEVSAVEIPLVFIRAPYVSQVEENVQVLLKIENRIVACRQNNMLVTSFHPELTDDLSFHRYFVSMIH